MPKLEFVNQHLDLEIANVTKPIVPFWATPMWILLHILRCHVIAKAPKVTLGTPWGKCRCQTEGMLVDGKQKSYQGIFSPALETWFSLWFVLSDSKSERSLSRYSSTTTKSLFFNHLGTLRIQVLSLGWFWHRKNYQPVWGFLKCLEKVSWMTWMICHRWVCPASCALQPAGLGVTRSLCCGDGSVVIGEGTGVSQVWLGKVDMASTIIRLYWAKLGWDFDTLIFCYKLGTQTGQLKIWRYNNGYTYIYII